MTLFLVILVFIDISNISNTRSCSLFSPVFLSSIYLLYFFISLFLYIGATLRPAGPICVTLIANHYSYALRCLLMTVFFFAFFFFFFLLFLFFFLTLALSFVVFSLCYSIIHICCSSTKSWKDLTNLEIAFLFTSNAMTSEARDQMKIYSLHCLICSEEIIIISFGVFLSNY